MKHDKGNKRTWQDVLNGVLNKRSERFDNGVIELEMRLGEGISSCGLATNVDTVWWSLCELCMGLGNKHQHT